MTMSGIYGTDFSVLEKNLDLRLQKHNLISSNIANMDTPNYKPFNLIVEKAFENNPSIDGKISLAGTNPLHINTADNPENPGSIINQKALVREDERVDIDKAMSDLSENVLLYSASAQILSKKLNMIKQSILGGMR
jgi:flagellar basal-body rod protein FlgB